MTFAQRLCILREQKKLTQEELAKLINVSQPSYNAYERGKGKPSKNTQIQLAKVLRVSVEELMKEEENESIRETEGPFKAFGEPKANSEKL